MILACDANVLIYAAAPHHSLGDPIRALLRKSAEQPTPVHLIGSVLLYPEILAKPLRGGDSQELRALQQIVSRIDLLPVDIETALTATTLGARYGLRAIDATHLATAVFAGADHFITNNSKDFSADITEIGIVSPAELLEMLPHIVFHHADPPLPAR